MEYDNQEEVRMDEELRNIHANAMNKIEFPSLLNGEMGVCIYKYLMGRQGYPTFSHEADLLLSKLIGIIHKLEKLDVRQGVVGNAIGIMYLVKEGVVEGDINEILYDICLYNERSITPYTKLMNIQEYCHFVISDEKYLLELNNNDCIMVYNQFSKRMDDCYISHILFNIREILPKYIIIIEFFNSDILKNFCQQMDTIKSYLRIDCINAFLPFDIEEQTRIIIYKTLE